MKGPSSIALLQNMITTIMVYEYIDVEMTIEELLQWSV